MKADREGGYEVSKTRPYMEAGNPPLEQITEGLRGLLQLIEHGAVTDAPTDDIIGAVIAAQILAGQLHVRVP